MKFRRDKFKSGRARRLFIPISEFSFAAFVVPMQFRRPAPALPEFTIITGVPRTRTGNATLAA